MAERTRAVAPPPRRPAVPARAPAPASARVGAPPSAVPLRTGAPPAAAPGAGHAFARISPHRPARDVRRLRIGPADDALEREAEQVAGKVARLSTAPPPPPADGTGEGDGEGKGRRPGRSPLQVQASRASGGGAGAGVAPPLVHDVLRSGGRPLDAAARDFAEPRFGHSFGHIRVHSDAQAARAAASVGARAFTVGSHLVFGRGEYAPASAEGRRLLAHELTHALQQEGAGEGFLQRTPCTDHRGGPFNVFIIGAPAPAEINASHPYQFMNAALYQGVTAQTVWIVERTGYEAGGVDTAHIASSVGPGCLIWLTPQHPLPEIINQEFPDGGIASATVFSHGLAGQVTLRYGWGEQGLDNYGLSMSQVRSFNPAKFAPGATFEFDSCNTGTTVDEGNLARETAYYTGTRVRAWTGRTSYSEVNDGPDDGDVSVQPSEVYRNSMDWTEVYSRARGRTPVLTTFRPPGPRVGGFSSSFEISARLPATQHFTVPQGGTVVVRCSNGTYVRPPRDPVATDRIGINLLQTGSVWDSRVAYESLTVGAQDIAIFPNLDAGDYYLEILFESAPVNDYETLESDIDVDVHDPPP